MNNCVYNDVRESVRNSVKKRAADCELTPHQPRRVVGPPRRAWLLTSFFTTSLALSFTPVFTLVLTLLFAPSVVAPVQAQVRVPTSVLERYVGDYSDPGDPSGNTTTIRLVGDTLFQETPGIRRILVPMSETRFWVGGVITMEFVVDRAGGVTALFSDGVEIENRLRRKGSPPAPPEEPVAAVRVPRSVLDRYVGTYEFIPGQMGRTDLRITVRREGNTLIRQLRPQETVVLIPLSDTRFRVSGTSIMAEFVVDDAGVTQIMGSGAQQLVARRTSKR